MEKQKLRLKEQLPSTDAPMGWLQNRYPQPKPPSAVQRLSVAVKRLGRVILLAVVCASVFLAIPFRRWDDYVIWQQARDALAKLEAQPDSLSCLKGVFAAAEAAHILWNEPSGARPEKWYQHAERNRYDASYGIVQVLALGLIMQGNVPRGRGELDRLHQRTDLMALPGVPGTDQVIGSCTRCKEGKRIVPCPACGGQSNCKNCDGQGTIPFSPVLKSKIGFHSTSSYPAKRLGDTPLIRPSSSASLPKCPKCVGTGKCPTCAGAGNRTETCQTCAGQVTIINFAAEPNIFQKSIRAASAAIDSDMTGRRVIHGVAALQGLFLRKGADVSSSALSKMQRDSFVKGVDSDASSSRPLPPQENVSVDIVSNLSAVAAVDNVRPGEFPHKQAAPVFFLETRLNKQKFGPYAFESDAHVGTEQNPYVLKLTEPGFFTLKSERENATYGPFKFQQHAVITVAKTEFLLVIDEALK